MRSLISFFLSCAFVLSGGAAFAAEPPPLAGRAADWVATQTSETPAMEGPLRINEDVTRPERLSGKPPVYHPLARIAGLAGSVIVESIIEVTGQISKVKVLKGLPLGLSRAAVDSMLGWRFTPAIFEGKPVRVYYVLTVNFQLEGDSPIKSQFKRLLRDNPVLAKKLQGKSASEVAKILAGRGEKMEPAEIPFLVFGVFLEQGRLKDSLEAISTYRGRFQYQALYQAGAVIWSHLYQNPKAEGGGRAELIELALGAAVGALEVKPDGLEALVFKALLLQEKSRITLDPLARAALLEEVARLRDRTIQLHPEMAKDGLIPDLLDPDLSAAPGV